jgi:hypothetical protein
MLMTGVTGRKYRFTYDTSGRPWQLMRTQLEGGFPDYVTATAAYDDWGRLQSVGGMSYQYNSFGQLSRYTHGTYDVSYDYVGSRGFNDGTLAAQTVNGALTSYTYDLLGRLETATRSGQWSQLFEYDGFGNLIKKTTGPTGGPADEPADGSGDVRCGGEPHLEPERGLRLGQPDGGSAGRAAGNGGDLRVCAGQPAGGAEDGHRWRNGDAVDGLGAGGDGGHRLTSCSQGGGSKHHWALIRRRRVLTGWTRRETTGPTGRTRPGNSRPTSGTRGRGWTTRTRGIISRVRDGS